MKWRLEPSHVKKSRWTLANYHCSNGKLLTKRQWIHCPAPSQPMLRWGWPQRGSQWPSAEASYRGGGGSALYEHGVWQPAGIKKGLLLHSPLKERRKLHQRNALPGKGPQQKKLPLSRLLGLCVRAWRTICRGFSGPYLLTTHQCCQLLQAFPTNIILPIQPPSLS